MIRVAIMEAFKLLGAALFGYWVGTYAVLWWLGVW